MARHKLQIVLIEIQVMWHKTAEQDPCLLNLGYFVDSCHLESDVEAVCIDPSLELEQ